MDRRTACSTDRSRSAPASFQSQPLLSLCLLPSHFQMSSGCQELFVSSLSLVSDPSSELSHSTPIISSSSVSFPEPQSRFLPLYSFFLHPRIFNLFIIFLPYLLFGVLLGYIFSNSLFPILYFLSYFLRGH